MLTLKDVHTHYGNIHALQGVSMRVEQGEIVTLIGSNGAGKTTTLAGITGLVPASGGSILFEGIDITQSTPSDIVKMGISMSPEGREVFPELTVEENLQLGGYTRGDKREIKASFERAYELFPRLWERKKQTAGTLSGGEQQMLAIGRSLMAKPKLLLLDEPSLGLAPNIVQMIFELIVDINRQGITVLLIEQNANMALRIAHRAYVLETGRVALEGPAADLLDDARIRRAYLNA